MLGITDQLFNDSCIVEEANTHQRLSAITYYDYKKAYRKLHNDSMLRMYKWVEIAQPVVPLLEDLISRRKTRLEVWKRGTNTKANRKRNLSWYLQENSYSPRVSHQRNVYC